MRMRMKMGFYYKNFYKNLECDFKMDKHEMGKLEKMLQEIRILNMRGRYLSKNSSLFQLLELFPNLSLKLFLFHDKSIILTLYEN